MRLVTCSVVSCLVLIIPSLSISPMSAEAYDDKIWLPKAYESHYLKLVKATEQALALERCVEILDATIDLGQSTQERPMYRILCQQANNRSYTEMVDGVTFDTLTTPKPPPETEEQKALRLAEELAAKKAALVKRIRGCWQLCNAVLLERTQDMSSLTWMQAEQPIPTKQTDDYVVFTVDFNANGLSGEKLRYRARCKVYENHELDLQMGARANFEQKMPDL